MTEDNVSGPLISQRLDQHWRRQEKQIFKLSAVQMYAHTIFQPESLPRSTPEFVCRANGAEKMEAKRKADADAEAAPGRAADAHVFVDTEALTAWNER
jgi:hypothetical protein